MKLPLAYNPFAVEAFFKHSVVLAYAVPENELRAVLPRPLTVDMFQERWGFVAAAFVDTKGLRPKGLPAAFGRDFVLAGYRIFVRYTDVRGRKLRGLYILRSETNSRFMRVMGNLLTSYNYHTTDISFTEHDSQISISAPRSGLAVDVTLGTDEAVPLPPQSIFSTWRDARRFAGPMPFTFSLDRSESRMIIVEGVRENWTPRPVKVLRAEIPTIAELGFPNAILANAFVVSNIPYHWKAGRLEKIGFVPQEATAAEQISEDL